MLENRIYYMGSVTRDQIPPIIMNASLLVLSRPDSTQAQGGFPTKLGEYLASGNPVCVTKVGEIPDYLIDNETAFLAEPGSVESFADAIDRALRNPKNAKRVGLNGRRVAEISFNKDIQAKKLYDFLIQLVNSKKNDGLIKIHRN
jgi:glycosyltransferase involved in cell wall biosynthesis